MRFAGSDHRWLCCSRRARRGSCVLLLGLWLCAACQGETAQFSLPPLPANPKPDGGSVPIPPGATLCSVSADCKDDVQCTRDLCVRPGYCVHLSDRTHCDDGVYCNGSEYCDPVKDCQAAQVRSCDDHDVCTIDSCDEANATCVHAPRDQDGDGETDWHCPGGTDCDDRDPRRGARIDEICRDTVDNDCDGKIDEVAACGGVPHDSCEDARVIDANGVFSVALRGAQSDYTLSCTEVALSAPDVVLALTLEAEHDLAVTARGLKADGDPTAVAIELRSRCSDTVPEIECRAGAQAQLRTRALAAGRNFVLLASQHAQEVVVDVRLSAPSAAAPNATCGTASLLGVGERVRGDFVDVSDDYELECGFAGASDLAYGFHLDQKQNVNVSLFSAGKEQMAFAVRRRCGDSATTLRCVRGAPALGKLYSLEPGEYALIVEGPAYREVDFTLDLTSEQATAVPDADSCATASPVEPDAQPTLGTLVGAQDFVTTSCGLHYPDAVYTLELLEKSDLALELKGARGTFTMAFSTQCDARSELLCLKGNDIRKRLRGVAAGNYYLVVEAPLTTDFALEAETHPPTSPLFVRSNDNCAVAFGIPSEGGVFRGDTRALLGDYEARCGGLGSRDAAFVIELQREMRVRAELESDSTSFDTVLYRFFDAGRIGAAACQSQKEQACNHHGMGGRRASALDELLPPGTHFFIVDGFGSNSAGPYTLDVDVTDPSP